MEKFMLEGELPKSFCWHDSNGKSEDLFDNNHREEYIPQECKPDAIFYWYVSGSWEGSGALIAVKDGKWYSKNLGHCSCYGPLEDFASDISQYTKDSLDDLINSGSKEWQEEYIPLISLARKKGYK